MRKKLLIIFSDKFSSEPLAKKASDEIRLFTNSKIKYHYDMSNSYFLFDLHEENYDLVEECLYNWLGEDNINYLMVSMEDRNNIHLLPENIYHMLNDINGKNDKLEKVSLLEKTEKDNHTSKLSEDDDLLDVIEFVMDDDLEDLTIMKLKNRKKEKTIDEILDKISFNGITSLTEVELKILKRKSIN